MKDVSSGNRVLLTENQQEMLATIKAAVERVHPVVVTVDLSGLPETTEVVVDIDEDSVCGGEQ